MTKWGSTRRRQSATRLCLASHSKTKEGEKRETCADGKIRSFSMEGETKVSVCND